MALHLQQQVLDAIKSLLAAGSTSARTVLLDRLDGIPAKDLPAIVIEEGEDGEESTPGTIHGLEGRALQVVIRCVVKRADGAAAASRALGLEVEKLVATGQALAALCPLGVRIESSRLRQEAEAEVPFAERVQTWRLSYFARATSPDVGA